MLRDGGVEVESILPVTGLGASKVNSYLVNWAVSLPKDGGGVENFARSDDEGGVGNGRGTGGGEGGAVGSGKLKVNSLLAAPLLPMFDTRPVNSTGIAPSSTGRGSSRILGL
jgi:hypothetical protein